MKLTLYEAPTRERKSDHNTGNSVPHSFQYGVWVLQRLLLTIQFVVFIIEDLYPLHTNTLSMFKSGFTKEG